MDPLILRLGLALAIGTLIGLERGWRERDAPGGSRTAGIRTFGMAGFFGGILAVIALAFAAPSVFIAGFLGFSAIFAVFEYRETQRDNVFSVTSTIAAMSTVVLGGLAVAGDFRVAAAGGAAVACLLASRELLHGLLRKLSWNEVRSTLTLAAMTAIGLPLLPNHPIDPWGGFNPFEVWLLTVLAGAISYTGYIAIRLLGPRGIIPASLLGGIVSSMAVTAALGRQVRSGDPVLLMVGGACLAGMVSILRVGLLITLIKPSLVSSILLPICVASIVLGAIGAVLSFHTVAAMPASPARRNPFDVTALLIFAAAFALISTLSAGLVQHFGAQSVLMTSSLAAVADVDIAVLSAVRMDGGDIDPVLKGVRGIAQEIEVRPRGEHCTADDEIAKRALSVIRWNTVIPEEAVLIKVQKGVVTLSGAVEWNYQKNAAAEAIRGLTGVIDVYNNIEVKPRLTAFDVKKRIEDALKRTAELEAKGIKVDVDGFGKVKLEGHVNAWFERKAIERAAWAAPGVKLVDDRITIG